MNLPDDWGLTHAHVTEAHEITGLPVTLIWAVLMQESSHDIMARRVEHGFYERYIRSKPQWIGHQYYKQPGIIAASFGLMQVMYTTAEWAVQKKLPAALCAQWDWTPWGLCAPRVNVLIGAAVLRYKVSTFGPRDGIAAYNAGSPRKDANGVLANSAYVASVEKWRAAMERQFVAKDA